MNALEAYFNETGDRPSTLAHRIGRAPSTITRALRGERDASAKLARDVEAGTGGQVTAQDFMAICMAARSRSAETAPPSVAA